MMLISVSYVDTMMTVITVSDVDTMMMLISVSYVDTMMRLISVSDVDTVKWKVTSLTVPISYLPGRWSSGYTRNTASLCRGASGGPGGPCSISGPCSPSPTEGTRAWPAPGHSASFPRT